MPDARVITVGPHMAAAVATLGLEHYPDTAKAKAALAGCFPKGSWVFLKASHGIHLEKFLPDGECPPGGGRVRPILRAPVVKRPERSPGKAPPG